LPKVWSSNMATKIVFLFLPQSDRWVTCQSWRAKLCACVSLVAFSCGYWQSRNHRNAKKHIQKTAPAKSWNNTPPFLYASLFSFVRDTVPSFVVFPSWLRSPCYILLSAKCVFYRTK
jgi:hypothetical protein